MTSPNDLEMIALVAPPARSATSPWVRAVLGDTGYRANSEAFAAQMEVFERIRQTEYAFPQRAKAPDVST